MLVPLPLSITPPLTFVDGGMLALEALRDGSLPLFALESIMLSMLSLWSFWSRMRELLLLETRLFLGNGNCLEM